MAVPRRRRSQVRKGVVKERFEWGLKKARICPRAKGERKELVDHVWVESWVLFCRREVVATQPVPSPVTSCPKGSPGVVAEAEWGGPGGSDTPPSLGPSLRPLDLEFMKHLSKVVNIIPVIAKADTMTLEEKSEFKQRVRRPFLLFLSPCLPLPFGSKPSPLLYYYIHLLPHFPPSSYSAVKEERLVEKRS